MTDSGPVRHDVWDVHCADSRWWVITQPTNLYSQEDFKSRDVALTFHVGLAIRVSCLHEQKVPVKPQSADLLPGSWRRWEQAFEAYDSGDEAEAFQSVGVRLRECLVSFVGETANDEMVPDGQERPKRSDFKGWTDLLANTLAGGDVSTYLRSYLKKMSVETWAYVNWLTHAKNAIRMASSLRPGFDWDRTGSAAQPVDRIGWWPELVTVAAGLMMNTNSRSPQSGGSAVSQEANACPRPTSRRSLGRKTCCSRSLRSPAFG